MNTPSPDGLSVLVVDDEQPALDELAWLLSRDSRVDRVSTCLTGAEALRILGEEHVDALLLDVEMPGLSGLELAAVLSRFSKPPRVVFVTAHIEHAVEAFDLHAVDYLLKPVREERLREAVRRVVAVEGPEDVGETIAVERAGVTRFLPRSEVCFIEAQGDYARLHTATDGHLVRMTLASLEERWGESGFVRIHRSFLVSLPHVESVRVDGGRCWVCVGGRDLQVSRRHTPALREELRRRGEP